MCVFIDCMNTIESNVLNTQILNCYKKHSHQENSNNKRRGKKNLFDLGMVMFDTKMHINQTFSPKYHICFIFSIADNNNKFFSC